MIDPELPIRSFFHRHHRPSLKATAAADYLTQLNHFEAYWRELAMDDDTLAASPRLCDLSTAHVAGARDWQLRPPRLRTKQTADKVRRALLAIWNRAHDLSDGAIARPGRIRGLGRLDYAPAAWTMDEFGQLLWGAAQLDERIGPFTTGQLLNGVIWTIYNSGLRISATMAIEKSWVNLASRRLVVDPRVQKDDEGRDVALLPETVEAITPFFVHTEPDRPRELFAAWPYDRGAAQWPALTLRLRHALVAGGLVESAAHVSRRDLWHKIRRTFATQIYLATGSIEDVKRRLGHSSIEVSYRYVDFSQVAGANESDLLPRPTPHRLRVVGE